MYNIGDIVFYKDFKVKAKIIHIDVYPEHRYLYHIKIIKSFNIDYPLNKITCNVLDRLDWFKLDGIEQIKKKRTHLPTWW